MVGRIDHIIHIVRALYRGENVGDVAVLKLALVSDREPPTPHSTEIEKMREITFRRIELDDVAVYPEGSLGRAYYEFMIRNSLKPFNFSTKIQDMFGRFPVTTRYARIHDMVHVFLGFETDLAGEMGVYSFIKEQNYLPALTRAFHVGRWVTRFMKPWAAGPMREAERRGAEMAKDAQMLLTENLEDRLADSLDRLRHELVPGYFRY